MTTERLPGYDSWKLASPDDGPYAVCDCCGKTYHEDDLDADEDEPICGPCLEWEVSQRKCPIDGHDNCDDVNTARCERCVADVAADLRREDREEQRRDRERGGYGYED